MPTRKHECKFCGVALTDENRKKNYNACKPCWNKDSAMLYRKRVYCEQPITKEYTPKNSPNCKVCSVELTKENRKGNFCITCYKRKLNLSRRNYEYKKAEREGRTIIRREGLTEHEKEIRRFTYNYRAELKRKGIFVAVSNEEGEKEYYRRKEAKAAKELQEHQAIIENAQRRLAEIKDVEEEFDFRKEWLIDTSRKITTEYMRNVPLEIVERECLRSIIDNDSEETQENLKQIYELLRRLDFVDTRDTSKRYKKYYQKIKSEIEYPYI